MSGTGLSGVPSGGASGAWRSVAAQARVELRLTARRGENLLALAGIPVVVLAFFASTSVVTVPGERPVDFLLPGALALAVVAAGLVNLGIATAYERSYGVLRRLAVSPLGRGGLVAAKLASVGVIVAIQVIALVLVASLVLGWRVPDGASLPLAVAAVILGTTAFTGLGLLLAGTLRAEATLALANGLFVLAVVIGGVVVPTDALPSPVGAIADLLPAAALADALRLALGSTPPASGGQPFLALAAWAIAAPLAASRTFRWS